MRHLENKSKDRLKDIHKDIMEEIDLLTSMVRSKITDVHRTSISALITSRVHDRDQLNILLKDYQEGK
jgi:hypothetical protein